MNVEPFLGLRGSRASSASRHPGVIRGVIRGVTEGSPGVTEGSQGGACGRAWPAQGQVVAGTASGGVRAGRGRAVNTECPAADRPGHGQDQPTRFRLPGRGEDCGGED